MACNNYLNAINHNKHEIPHDHEFTHIMRFKKDDIEVHEVKTAELNTSNTQKLMVNGNIKVYLHFGHTFKDADDSYGIYLSEADMTKDIIVWFNKRLKLQAKYKDNYDKSTKIVNKVREYFKGKEEFLI